MPRLRLAEPNCKGKGRSRRQVSSSSSTTSGRAASCATNAAASTVISKEKSTANQLHDMKNTYDDLQDEFPDFAYDEFEFDVFNSSRKSSGIDHDISNYSTDKATSALTSSLHYSTLNYPDDIPRKNKKSPKKNSHSTSMNSIQSPTISSRTITINDLSKSEKKACSKRGGNSKLFNSSLEKNDENDDYWLNSKNERSVCSQKMNMRQGNSSNKKQKVSFAKSAKSSLGSSKKIEYAKKSSKNKSKPSAEEGMPQNALSDDDGLHDTDDEDAQSTAAILKTSHDSSKCHIIPPTNATRMVILPSRGIAIDNRAFPTVDGDSMTRHFLCRMVEFIEGALEKKVLSDDIRGGSVIASLVKQTAGSRGDRVGNHCVVGRASYLFEDMGVGCGKSAMTGANMGRRERTMWFSDFLTPINCGLGHVAALDEAGPSQFDYDADESMQLDFMKRIGQTTLEGFTSSDSWNLFSDFVMAMHRKVSSPPTKSPYALSIFTTDAIFFADTDPESHVVGFDRFWKCVSTSIREDAVSSITIIIVDTTSAVQLMKAARDYDSLNDQFSNSALPSRIHIFQCINKIHQRIQELSEAVQRVKLEFMDGVVDFQTLLQMWVRESFNQTYRSETDTNSVDGKLRFELPETIDGTMCSISLDLSYTILPNRIDSPSTKELVKDMKMLSSLSPAAVEVLQAIPLQSVDSSLIYGVPMYARAGLEHDLSQYNQMKMLVRQLWKYLSRNDVALILRVRGEAGEEEDDGLKLASKSRACNQCCDQLFLLTSQVAVQKQVIHLNTETSMESSKALEVFPDRERKGEDPCNGILYRYATKNQILHFGSEECDSKYDEEEQDSAEANEYMDYIERSMDMLTSTGLNPFLVDENLNCG